MNQTLSRAVGFGLMLAISSAGMPVLAQDAVAQNQPAASAQNSSAPAVDLPDSPGAVNSQSSVDQVAVHGGGQVAAERDGSCAAGSGQRRGGIETRRGCDRAAKATANSFVVNQIRVYRRCRGGAGNCGSAFSSKSRPGTRLGALNS